jgi:anti-anti-sigma factor
MEGLIAMITKTQNPTVFKVNEKDLDILSMPIFESELDLLLNSTANSVYLDFTEVEEISSAILGSLLAKKMKLKKMGTEIHLLHLSNSLQRVLKILNLSEYFLPA